MSSASAVEVGQKNSTTFPQSSDQSTEQSKATSADALNSAQTASQTQFADGSAEVLTDDEKKKQEKNLKKASKLKDLIEAELGEHENKIEAFKAAANALMDPRFNDRIKATALDMLASEVNIAGIAMQMQPDEMGDILDENAEAAVKVLNALCLKKAAEEEDPQGQVKQAVAILAKMYSRNAAEALRGMDDVAIVAIAMQMQSDQMGNILNGNVEAAVKVLNALCLKKAAAEEEEEDPQGQVKQAVAILAKMYSHNAAEALRGMDDVAIAGIAMQMQPDQMGDILNRNVEAAVKVLNALCLKKAAEEEDPQGQIRQAAAILMKTWIRPAAAALLKMGDDVVVAIAMQMWPDQMGNILNGNVEAAVKVLNALCLKKAAEEDPQGQVKQAAAIFTRMSCGKATEEALIKMEVAAIVKIAVRVDDSSFQVIMHALSENADFTKKVLNALYEKGKTEQMANTLVEMDRKTAAEALLGMGASAIASIIMEVKSEKVVCMAFIINSNEELNRMALEALKSGEDDEIMGGARDENVENILRAMECIEAMKKLGEEGNSKLIFERIVGMAIANISMVVLILNEDDELAAKVLNALCADEDTDQKQLQLAVKFLLTMEPKKAAAAFNGIGEDRVIARLIANVGDENIEKIALILNGDGELTAKVLNALCSDESASGDQLQLAVKLLLAMEYDQATAALEKVANVEVIIKLVMGAGDEKILDMAFIIYSGDQLVDQVIEALESNKNGVAEQEVRRQMAHKITSEMHYIEEVVNELQEEGKSNKAIIECINKVALRSIAVAGAILNKNDDIAEKILTTLCSDESANEDQLQFAVKLLLAMECDKAKNVLEEIDNDSIIARLTMNIGDENIEKMTLLLNKHNGIATKMLSALCLDESTNEDQMQLVARLLLEMRHEIAADALGEVGNDSIIARLIVIMDGKSIEKTALILNESNGLTEKFLNALRPDETTDGDQMQFAARLLLEMRRKIAADMLGEVKNGSVIARLIVIMADKSIEKTAMILNRKDELAAEVLNVLCPDETTNEDQMQLAARLLLEMRHGVAAEALGEVGNDSIIARLIVIMDGKSIEKTALILNESNGLTEKFLNALRPDESIDEDQMQLVARLLLEMRHEIAADALGEVENVEVIIKLVMGAGDEKILDMALLIYDHEELRSKVIEALMSNKNSVADQEIREQMARKIPEEVHYIEKITNELQEEGKDDEAIIACINKVALRSTTMAGLILNDNADIARKVLITLCPDENGNGDQLQLAVSLLLAMKYDRAAEALGGIKDCKVIARLIANMGVENTKKIALILSKDMNLAEKVLTALRSAADGAYGEKSLEQMADAIDHEINCIYVSIYEKECDNEIIEFIMKTALNNMNRIVSILEVDVEFAEESLKLLRSSGKNKKQKVATAISQKMKNREKLLKDIALVECGDIVQGVMPMENVSVNSSKSADLPTERGKSNDEIQPKINSVPFIGNDKKIQLEMGKSKDLTSAEAKKSPLYGVWLRVITATVGCGALAGIAIIIALEIVAAVIPLMATLVALVLASIAIECASFALEKGEHNPSDAAK